MNTRTLELERKDYQREWCYREIVHKKWFALGMTVVACLYDVINLIKSLRFFYRTEDAIDDEIEKEKSKWAWEVILKIVCDVGLIICNVMFFKVIKTNDRLK